MSTPGTWADYKKKYGKQEPQQEEQSVTPQETSEAPQEKEPQPEPLEPVGPAKQKPVNRWAVEDGQGDVTYYPTNTAVSIDGHDPRMAYTKKDAKSAKATTAPQPQQTAPQAQATQQVQAPQQAQPQPQQYSATAEQTAPQQTAPGYEQPAEEFSVVPEGSYEDYGFSAVPYGSYGEATQEEQGTGVQASDSNGVRVVPREEGILSPEYYVDDAGVEHWPGKALEPGYSEHATVTTKEEKQYDPNRIAQALESFMLGSETSKDSTKPAKIDSSKAMALAKKDYNTLTPAEKRLVDKARDYVDVMQTVRPGATAESIAAVNPGVTVQMAQHILDNGPKTEEEWKIVNRDPGAWGLTQVPSSSTGTGDGTGTGTGDGKGQGTGAEAGAGTGTDGAKGIENGTGATEKALPTLEDFYKSLYKDPTLSEADMNRLKKRERLQQNLAAIGDMGRAFADVVSAGRSGVAWEASPNSLSKVTKEKYDKWRQAYEDAQDTYKNGLASYRIKDIENAREDRKQDREDRKADILQQKADIAQQKQDWYAKDTQSKIEDRAVDNDLAQQKVNLEGVKVDAQRELMAAQTAYNNAKTDYEKEQAAWYGKLSQAKIDHYNAQDAYLSAQAAEKKAQIEVDRAKVVLERAQAQAAIAKGEAAKTTASAAVTRAQAAVTNAQANLSKAADHRRETAAKEKYYGARVRLTNAQTHFTQHKDREVGKDKTGSGKGKSGKRTVAETDQDFFSLPKDMQQALMDEFDIDDYGSMKSGDGTRMVSYGKGPGGKELKTTSKTPAKTTGKTSGKGGYRAPKNGQKGHLGI